MRLIDADALLESEIERYGCVPAVCTTTINGEYLDDVLDRQPTIDAEPVRHGKWQPMNERNEIYGDVYMCDNCGHGFVICENFHCCPNCGAKMG